MKPLKTPILDALMEKGIIRKIDYEYIGTAADGINVTIGCVLYPRDLERIENWLRDYPTPDLW